MLESQSLDNLDSALRNVTRSILTTECGNQLTRFLAREQALAEEYLRRGESIRFIRIADETAAQFAKEQSDGER